MGREAKHPGGGDVVSFTRQDEAGVQGQHLSSLWFSGSLHPATLLLWLDPVVIVVHTQGHQKPVSHISTNSPKSAICSWSCGLGESQL